MRGPAVCDATDLCDEIAGLRHNGFAATYAGDPPQREIYSADELRLIVDLSPLLAGHMLLVPERHYLSFGHLVPEMAAKTSDLLTTILPLYLATFGQAAVLEHGSSSSQMTSACITHAHWHLIPLCGGDIRRSIVDDGLVARRLQSFEELYGYAEADKSYFYCFDGETHYAFTANHRVPSQYLRSVVGGLLGIPDPLWDWSLIVRKDLLRETLSLTRDWSVKLGVR